MKKTITLLTLIFTLSFTMNVMAQTRLGVKGGLNYSHVRVSDAEEQKELSARPSFHLGVVGDIAISKQVSFQPQLLLSQRGAKVKHEDHDDVLAFTSIEIPLNVVYRLKDNGFFAGGGPVLGYNLSGKVKGHDESKKIELGNNAGEIKQFDLGANAFAGYQLNNGLFFTVNYTLGLTNWSNVPNATWRNNILGVSVGYFFKTKAKKG